MKILIINGPNLNLLGIRDKAIYGELSLDDINNELVKEFPQVEFQFFQSNNEGSIIDKIHSSDGFDGIIINPGGYSHTSVAIKDALDLIKIPKIEVHLSNLSKRESFRQNLITASSCDGYISGMKQYSYFAAVYSIIKLAQIRDKLN